MGQNKRIRRGTAGWQKVISRQMRSGLPVQAFCKSKGINASLFRRWQLRLSDSQSDGRSIPPAESAVAHEAPFIELGDLRSGAPRLEVRLELGGGLVLSIARG